MLTVGLFPSHQLSECEKLVSTVVHGETGAWVGMGMGVDMDIDMDRYYLVLY